MTSLATLVASYARAPSAACYLDGQRWYDAKKFSTHQKFKEQIETGSIEGRNPPVAPRIGMSVRLAWGYNGVEVAAFTGYVSDTDVASYPNTDRLTCSGVLWLADQNNEVLQTSPLNSIKASDAARYLLNSYGNIPASKLNLPVIPASGAAWAGSEWTLGILTPVQWGDPDTQSGGTTAMKAAAQIYGDMGFWLYATPDGKVTAKQMEKKPSTQAREVFRIDVNLLLKSPPHRQASYANVYNQATVKGANTGVDGAQLYDQRRTTSPLLKAGVHKDFPYSSFLLEYENEADAGVACVSKVTERVLNVVSRIPDVIPPFTVKADPNRRVGDTVGVINTALRLSTQKNYFIYELTRTLDLDTGLFDDQISLDGGTGSTGFTTVPPPDASFSWRLAAETTAGDAIVEVFLDGSASTSPSGEIVSWAWSTSTTTYGGSPSSATGVHACFVFLASASPATVTLTVTDTTSKTGTFTASIDLTGADTTPPFIEALVGAAGAALYATPDGGGTWNVETSNGDAISVGTIGAGADQRGAGTAGTYGVVATRGSGGAGGLRQSLDLLATASTNLVSNSGAITSNIWVNEANPARVWFAIGTAVYRSLDGGVTKTAMRAAPASVSWIMEDPNVDNSVFLLAGANMYNATDPTLGWALLYSGPGGATARQFVRSRDGQVTWICYTGAPSGQALQRVETGALADIAVTAIRTLALDRNATSLLATLYAITADTAPQIWSFDGLTGLSAVQSSQTFPSGTTVQHMLGSRQVDVIYTADYDSVTAGTGAFRKWLPIADRLLLWKALATGQQGHMLGLSAATVAYRATIFMLPSGASGAADKLFILDAQTGVWASKALPAASKSDWRRVRANPFDSRKLLLLRTAPFPATNDNALYYSADSGDTWTTVFQNLTASSQFLITADWSPAFGEQWNGARWDGSHGHLFRGTNDTYTEVTLGTAGQYTGAPGAAGEAITMDVSGAQSYVDVANAIHAGSTGSFAFGFFSVAPTGRRAAYVRESGEEAVRVTQDYTTGAWASLSGTDARAFLGILADNTILCGGRFTAMGIQEVADAWGSASAAVTAFAGDEMGALGTDAQTHTIAAAVWHPSSTSTCAPAVRSPAGGWTLLPRPPAATDLADVIEVVNVTG